MNTEEPFVSGVLLAAGASKRLTGDRPKQLLLIDGEPLVRRVAKNVLESRLRELIVVVGFMADSVRSVLSDLEVNIVNNVEYAKGQSSSVKLGLRSVNSSTCAALFIPADQPFLNSTLLDELISTYEGSGGPIVMPTYKGRRGAPLLFDRSLFPELASITGDEGGRQILKRHQSEIVTVTLDSERPLLDIDTPQIYRKLVGERQ
ncbi:MAG: NTP transferase domain-containing protein [Acidobacteriota bacterium]